MKLGFHKYWFPFNIQKINCPTEIDHDLYISDHAGLISENSYVFVYDSFLKICFYFLKEPALII